MSSSKRSTKDFKHWKCYMSSSKRSTKVFNWNPALTPFRKVTCQVIIIVNASKKSQAITYWL